jgi:hypothetical protein
MSDQSDKAARALEADASKGPVGGQGRTAPKPDPVDGAAIDDLTRDRQPDTGPKG